jgi:enamine deaminase RidA (YjgF/YER057c/UK114 family)
MDANAPHVRRINPPALAAPTGYTHVVEVTGAAKTVYVAGQVAFNERREVVGVGDMAAQAEQVYRNLKAALAAAGASFTDVVKMTTFITDEANIPALREVRAVRLGKLVAPPCNTLLVVRRLAEPEFQIEIEVVAAVPLD